MICENCKIIIPDSAAACPRCGIYLQAEDLFAETAKAEKQKTMLICPKCGAAHTLTAQFCRNDGTALRESFSKKEESEQTNKEMNDNKAFDASKNKQGVKKHSITWRWASALAFAFLLAGIGIYSYFSVNKGLKTDNLNVISNNNINKSDNGQSYLNGSIVQNQNSENLLLSTSKMEKSYIDIARLEVEINRALRKKGIYGIYVEVDTDLVASLTGGFITKKDRDKALNLIASYKELSGIKEIITDHTASPQVNIAKLGSQINNALRDAGIRGVVVEVDNVLHVKLKGAVSSEEEKNKAFEIVGLFKEAKKIKDLIFIVES